MISGFLGVVLADPVIKSSRWRLGFSVYSPISWEPGTLSGSETELVVKIGEAQVIVETHGRPALNPGDKVTFAVDPGNVHLFDHATGARLTA